MYLPAKIWNKSESKTCAKSTSFVSKSCPSLSSLSFSLCLNCLPSLPSPYLPTLSTLFLPSTLSLTSLFNYSLPYLPLLAMQKICIIFRQSKNWKQLSPSHSPFPSLLLLLWLYFILLSLHSSLPSLSVLLSLSLSSLPPSSHAFRTRSTWHKPSGQTSRSATAAQQQQPQEGRGRCRVPCCNFPSGAKY